MHAYSPALREAVRLALEQGLRPADIAERSGISARTVRRYRQQYRQLGHLQPRPHPGRRRLIPRSEHERLAAQVRHAPAATLAMHCRMWEAQTGVRVSVTTMSRSIRRLGWTRQRRYPGRR